MNFLRYVVGVGVDVDSLFGLICLRVLFNFSCV